MIKLRIFVSSVQKELAEERYAVKTLIASDRFLDEHCVPILYEDESGILKPAPQGYLDELARCQIYLGIIGSEYGTRFQGLSATHHEYHYAKRKGMPVLVCVRGDNRVERDSATRDFIEEIRGDGYKYQRFSDPRALQQVVLKCLIKNIKDSYHVAPSPKDSETSQRTIAYASGFDQQRMPLLPELQTPARVGWDVVDRDIARQLVGKTGDDLAAPLSDREVIELLLRRGLLWFSPQDKQVYCSPAGVLLFARDPASIFPQCCVRLLSFQDVKRDSKPADFMDVSAPISKILEMAQKFIEKNTRHPLRVVGLRRFRLDEYPVTALREAVINAMAHRDYGDVSRKIHVELFADRIEVISPGLLPHGVTLAQMRSGRARPCSRNPVLAQGLRLLGLMEEMGTGVHRMNQAMRDHGLRPPEYSYRDTHFVVTFRGPGKSLAKLKPQESRTVFEVRSSVRDQLTVNQKTILREMLVRNQVEVPKLVDVLRVTEQAVRKDLAKLQKFNLVEKRGAARATYYVLKEQLPA